jgi:hypothetical protein
MTKTYSVLASVALGLSASPAFAVCVPITGAELTIPVSATDLYIGDASVGDLRVLAGSIPSGDQIAGGGTYGKVSLHDGFESLAPRKGIGHFMGRRIDGTSIDLTIHPADNRSSADASKANRYAATGTLHISPVMAALLLQAGQARNQFGLTGTGVSNAVTHETRVCVDRIALSLNRTMSSYADWLYLGTVYFYMNGSNSGLAIDF